MIRSGQQALSLDDGKRALEGESELSCSSSIQLIGFSGELILQVKKVSANFSTTKLKPSAPFLSEARGTEVPSAAGETILETAWCLA